MNQKEIKRRVRQFRREFSLKECKAVILAEIFRKQGFTLIEYHPVLNDQDVETIINSFGLKEMITRRNGFIFTDKTHRLVFVNQDLTETEKMLVLAHEEGHFYLGHTKENAYLGRDVTEEFEANEFAHFLLQGTVAQKLRTGVSSHKKALIAGIVAAALAGGAGIGEHEYEKYQERQIYEGEFYVTMHGEKYHREDCVTIRGHETRRLTKKDVEEGLYSPCSVCRPDQ